MSSRSRSPPQPEMSTSPQRGRQSSWQKVTATAVGDKPRITARGLKIGDGPQGVIFSEIQAAWLDDAIATSDGSPLRIDVQLLDPLARLGGDDFAELGNVFTVARPN